MPGSESFRKLVRDRVGVELSERSCASISAFLASRCVVRGYDSEDAYVSALATRNSSDPEFRELVASVTNGQTSFFRHIEQFRAIGDLVAAIRRKERRPARIWCAACATGEEAYSVAMIADREGEMPELLATDVNEVAIDAARLGEYGSWTLRDAWDEIRRRYVVERDGRLAVVPEVRKRIRFVRHNLLDEMYPRPERGLWDIVLCRNVFIYFRRETINYVLGRLAEVLAPGGYLFIGGSESIHGVRQRFSLVKLGECFAYRLLEGDSQGAEPPESDPLAAGTPSAALGQAWLQDDTAMGGTTPPCGESRDGRSGPEMTAGTTPPEHEMAAAVEAASRGDRREALEVLRSHVTRAPWDVAARITMGNLLLQERDSQGAADHYSAALDLDPLCAEAHLFLGILYRKSGDVEQAIEAFRRVLFLDASFWPASFYLAGLYARLGRREKARQEYENTLRALSGSPTLPSVRSRLHDLDDMMRFKADVRAACTLNLSRLSSLPD